VIVVDAVRIPEQLELLRVEPGFQVILIYVNARRKTLAKRYAATAGSGELPSYQDVLANETERRIGRMRSRAGLRVNTTWLPPSVVSRAALIGIAATRVAWTLRTWPSVMAAGILLTAAFAAPIAWSLLDWKPASWLIVAATACFLVLFAMLSTLIGVILTAASPIERDPT
jgi:hypothetical protein